MRENGSPQRSVGYERATDVSDLSDLSDLSEVSDAATGRWACPGGLKEVQRRGAMALFYSLVGIYVGFGAWTWWQLLHAFLH